MKTKARKTVREAETSATPLVWMAVAALYVVSPQPTFGATATFFDPTLNDGDWTATRIVDTTPGQTATFMGGQQLVGGNPGSYRQVTHTLDAGALQIAHLRDTGASPFRWIPSTQGAISSLDYSFDLTMTGYTDPTGTTFGGVAYHLLLFQSGNYYASTRDIISGPAPGVWQSFSHAGLTASDFARLNLSGGGIDASSHPDFSGTGGLMAFGYQSANSHTSPNIFKGTVSGIDNYLVTFTVVPEPAIWQMLAVGTVAGVLLRHWRKPQRLKE